MKKLLLITAVSTVFTFSALAIPSYYIAGTMNGWDASGFLMTDLGGGIYQAILTGLTPDTRYEFKITDGDWSWSVPNSGNSWLYTDGSGDVTITYDINTYADGWDPTSGRSGVNNDPGTWTAVGDWQGWNNSNPATVMTAEGGGIYELQYSIGSPGWYQYKAVDTGSWDAIGADSRSVNANTYWFQTTAPDQMVDFYVNALNGTIQVDVLPVPEPSTLAILGLSGLVMLMVARKRN